MVSKNGKPIKIRVLIFPPYGILARLIFFQKYPRTNPDYIIRTLPDYIIRTGSVNSTETKQPKFACHYGFFIIVF